MTQKKFVLIDKKFKENKQKYILQSLMAAATVSCILVFLQTLFGAAVLAAFGATCFIVFAMPHKRRSNNRAVLGGYLVGMISGFAMLGIYHLIMPAVNVTWLIDLIGAFAIALSIFIMAITNTEHPPAAGVALGIVIDGFEPLGILVLALAVIFLILIKRILKRWMIDLV